MWQTSFCGSLKKKKWYINMRKAMKLDWFFDLDNPHLIVFFTLILKFQQTKNSSSRGETVTKNESVKRKFGIILYLTLILENYNIFQTSQEILIIFLASSLRTLPFLTQTPPVVYINAICIYIAGLSLMLLTILTSYVLCLTASVNVSSMMISISFASRKWIELFYNYSILILYWTCESEQGVKLF